MFDSKPLTLTTADQDIYICPSGQEGSVHGLVLSNITGSTASWTLKFYDQDTATTTTVVSSKTLAANDFIAFPKPINIKAGDKLIASASANSAIVLLFSVYLDTATSYVTAFPPKGTWSNSVTYGVGDVARYSVSSYASRVSNINKQPDTNPTEWMPLVTDGSNGSNALFLVLGAWSNATTYGSGNIVTNYGSTYIATASNTNSEPTLDSTNANWLSLYQSVNEPVTSVTYAASISLNASQGNNFTVVATGNPTISITGSPPSGKYKVITLIFTHSGAPRAITWGASIKWTDNTAPTTSSSSGAIDVFTFWTVDGGTNWYGSLAWWSVT